MIQHQATINDPRTPWVNTELARKLTNVGQDQEQLNTIRTHCNRTWNSPACTKSERSPDSSATATDAGLNPDSTRCLAITLNGQPSSWIPPFGVQYLQAPSLALTTLQGQRRGTYNEHDDECGRPSTASQ